MPKISTPKPETTFRAARAKERDYKIIDADGLYMLVRKSGTRVWRYRYRPKGSDKENTLTIGSYPMVGLSEARQKRDEAKRQIFDGLDPNKEKAEKSSERGNSKKSFEYIARDWFNNYVTWVEKHRKNILKGFENDVFPKIGNMHIDTIKPTHIVEIIREVASRDAKSVAIRVGQHIAAIYDHAINQGLCEYNPAQNRAKIIKAPKVKHRPHLKAEQLPDFFKRLNEHKDSKEYIKLGLILQLLTMVRPGELRLSEWSEFNLEKAEWFIPGKRMKKGRDHLIPLSTQAVQVIARLKQLTGNNKYLFPGTRATHKPISDATIIKLVRLMGYSSEELVPHGLRGTASTILNQKGYNSDWIERQLAHVEENKIRGAYNHADYLPDRKDMLQWWADFLDRTKVGNVSLNEK